MRSFPPSRARELRKVQTPAETALWNLLRDRRLQKLKFRRQMPISIYFADFYCHAIKLIVELDGEVHDAPRQRVHDQNRDAHLRSLGCTVLRFTNEDLFKAPETVLQRILDEAQRLAALSKAEISSP